MPSSNESLKSLGHTAMSLTWQPGSIQSGLALGSGNTDTQGQRPRDISSFIPLTVNDWSTANPDNEVNTIEQASFEEEESIFPLASVWLPQELENYGIIYGKQTFQPSHEGSSPKIKRVYQRASQIVNSAENQAQEIIAQAENMAKEIIHEAENQANEIKNKAYAEGLTTSNVETQGLLTTVQVIVDEVQNWKNNLLEQGEMMMLRLVIEIAQTIFGDGLPLDPDSLGQVFSRALSQARNLGDLRIYVHPDDAISLSSYWSRMQTSFSGQKIELVPSEIIKRGGCFIDGQFGTIDARVETQLDLVKESLLTKLENTNGREE